MRVPRPAFRPTPTRPSLAMARLLVAALVALSAALVPLDAGPSLAASGTCATTTFSTYSIQVCVTAPAAGATVSGDVGVTVSTKVLSGKASVQKTITTLDGGYLITDFQTPYGYTLRTPWWADGAHTLAVKAYLRDGNVTNAVSETLTFANGVTSPPPASGSSFGPTGGTAPGAGSPLVVAAAGDGAAGETATTNVVNLIKGWNPSLFLYLGDVYDDGSSSEFLNWYDPTYGQLRGITDPVVGNHEYTPVGTGYAAPGYFGYWGQSSDTYSFDAGGWHFIALNSNSNPQYSSAQQAAQLQWLQSDLAAHQGACILAFWHHPLYTVGKEGAGTQVTPYWQALANAHATLVLNGHDHTYQRWTALDANGSPSSNGLTEIVDGLGGHSAQSIVSSDPRVVTAFGGSTSYFGAVKVSLTATQAAVQYVTSSGTTMDQATIPCQGIAYRSGTVAGAVTDATSGTPLSGATVAVSGGPSTTTDASGAYTLAGVAPGTVTVTASDGTAYGAQSAQVTVSAGTTTSQSFALAPSAGGIAGTVTDATSGTALASATVSIAGGASTTTDAAGRYAFGGLAAGSYNLTASATGYAASSPVSVSVASGATTTQSFGLSPLPGGIAGTVTDAGTGTAIAGATVALAGGASTTTDASGAYSFSGLAPGGYTVSASATGYVGQSASVTVAPAATATQGFGLSPATTPGAVSGTVRDAVTGSPIAGASVSTTGASATSDATGAYTLSGLAPGSYQVTASATNYRSASATVSVGAGTTATQDFGLSGSPVFSDGFESGSTSAWTSATGLTVEGAIVHSGSWAAEGSTTNGATYARRTLSTAYTDLYYRVWFLARTLPASGTTVNLMGDRTAASGSIVRLYLDSSGRLGLRNDVAATSTTGPTVGVGTWHSLELHATINGTISATQVWLDGSPVSAFSLTTNLGTTAIGQIQLGENQTARTYDVVWDDAVAQLTRIGP